MTGEAESTRIRTPDQRVRVFVSSTLGELADERHAARRAVEQLRLAPIMFELGARPHPPRALYRSYLEQSDVFVGIYWQRYGWVAPDMDISGLEDEYRLSTGMPRLVYVKRPAPDMEPRLRDLLDDMQGEDAVSYKPFRDATELEHLLLDDLAILLAERFERSNPSVTASASTDNLPSPPSTFVGREAALADLERLIVDDGVRIVTLTGSGGIGKTRLALAVAHRHLNHFADGVFFVDLSEQRTQEGAYAAMLQATAPGERGEDGPLEALIRGLRDRHTLLVLDNFEQVTTAAAGVSELLARCPRVHALVTSREALRIRGELRYEVPPLSLPVGDGGGLTAETAAHYEAIRLFRDRAAAVRADFELDDANVTAIAAICERLDALPLAIELAAARVNLFSVDELRRRLETQLQLLGTGGLDVPERQQTLRATIEWSNELLNEPERLVFRLCSVFVDAQLVDIEATAARTPALASLDIVDRVASLVDKSLVKSVAGLDGRPRFSMLQTVRDYVSEQLSLDPDFEASIKRSHAEQYSEVANRLRDSATSLGRATVLATLSSELGNLLIAWSYWVSQGDVARLNELLEPLWGYYDARGNYRAAADLGEDLLGVLERQPETPERLRDQLALETSLARSLLTVTGFSSDSEQRITEILDRSSASGEATHRFPALRSLGSLYMLRSDVSKASAVTSDLLAIAEQQQDPALLADANLLSGVIKLWTNDMPAALRHIESAVEYSRRARPSYVQLRVGPDPRVLSQMVSGLVTWMAGSPDRARAQIERGVELAKEIDHPYSVAYGLFHAALLDLWSQDLVLLSQRADQLLEVATTHDYPIWRALAHVLRGTARVASEVEGGLEEVDRGFELYEGLSTPPIFWPALLTIRARANLMAGDGATALAYLGEAESSVTSDDPLLADMAITRGDVLLAVPRERAASEQAYERAVELARMRGLRMVELEAATKLASMRLGTALEEESITRVRDLLETFDEGFATPQLRSACALVRR